MGACSSAVKIGGRVLTRATGRLPRNIYAITHSQTNTSWVQLYVATTVYERILVLKWLDPDPFVFAAAAMSLDRWLKLAAESALESLEGRLPAG